MNSTRDTALVKVRFCVARLRRRLTAILAAPGIPSALLNQGMINNQNVAVLLYNADETKPDFKASTKLCLAMSKLVPGASCDIPMLQKEAEMAQEYITETEKHTRGITDTMYG